MNTIFDVMSRYTTAARNKIMNHIFDVMSRYTTAARNKTDVLVSRALESINSGQVKTLLDKLMFRRNKNIMSFFRERMLTTFCSETPFFAPNLIKKLIMKTTLTFLKYFLDR